MLTQCGSLAPRGTLDEVVFRDVDHAERRGQRRDGDRGGLGAVVREQGLEVDVEELVAVEREAGPAFAAPRAANRRPLAPPQRLLLAGEGEPTPAPPSASANACS